MSEIRKITCANPDCNQGPNGTTPEHQRVFECVSTVMYDHLGRPLRVEREAHVWTCGACARLAGSAPVYEMIAVRACVRDGDEGLGEVVPDAAATTWRCPQCSTEHKTKALLEHEILNGNLETETGTIWACCDACGAELTVKVHVTVQVVSAEVTVFTPEEDA